jgi:DNA-binding response OmpR family regulator
MKVLLVEDETALADVIGRNVAARGHDVTTAPSAQAAMTSLNADWPDAIVLDINLPDESGWEILRRLGPERRAAVRVVVISAAPISPKRLAEFQPARWFLKPFPLDALMRALSNTPPEEGLEDQA